MDEVFGFAAMWACAISISLPNDMLKEVKDKCAIPTLTSCVTCTCSFNFWMFLVGFDTFVMVVKFINNSQEPTHVTIGIFEIHNIVGATMAN
jgi:hypothetical protein